MVKVKTEFGPSGEDGSLGDSVDAARGGVTEPHVYQAKAGDPEWLKIAKDAYMDSTRYIDSSLRWQWERNERAFQSRHYVGSKYLSASFRYRTKLFRPKTRAMIRTAEAQAAQAFFANEDVVKISAANPNDPRQRASAEINKELLQYRLTTPNHRLNIPWFMTVVGAYQNAQKYGFVASKQWWEYVEHEENRTVPEVDAAGQQVFDEEDRPVFKSEKFRKVIFDRPRCDLIPPENLRFDRGADWIDPINTSPVVIVMTPMYVHDVEQRMQKIDSKTGQPVWFKVDRPTLQQARNRHVWDSTRSQREGSREDSKESEIAIDDYQIVWIHENFVRWQGREYVYDTVGINAMLSAPQPLEERYAHCRYGQRPITMGFGLVETHKIYPSGKPQLTEQLQHEANELVNLRQDNIKLALNKRYKVRRGRQVDLQSILRNVPGSVTLVHDMDDVDVIETRDVTQSSFMEQDRINADFDDIAGNFSQGTVSTNRRMNETVGGMQMLSGAANQISELDLRVFTETWTEPTITQILSLIQHYETDTTLIALMADQAQIWQRYGIDQITDDMLTAELTTKVNVGLGATDPMQQLQKFRMGAETIGAILGPEARTLLRAEEVISEVFAPLGYRDGKRFFDFGDGDPMIKILQKRIEDMEREKERRDLENETKRMIAELQKETKIMAQVLENAGMLEQTRLKIAHEGDMKVMDVAQADRDQRQQSIDDLRKTVIQGLFQREQEEQRQRADRRAANGSDRRS